MKDYTHFLLYLFQVMTILLCTCNLLWSNEPSFTPAVWLYIGGSLQSPWIPERWALQWQHLREATIICPNSGNLLGPGCVYLVCQLLKCSLYGSPTTESHRHWVMRKPHLFVLRFIRHYLEIHVSHLMSYLLGLFFVHQLMNNSMKT